MSSPHEQISAREGLARIRDLIAGLVPDWLPSRRALLTAIIVAALGYVAVAAVAVINLAASPGGYAVIYAMAPINFAMLASRGIAARRFRGALAALDTPTFADIRSEIVKRTHGLHRSSATGIAFLLVLAAVLLIGNIGISIALGSFGLTVLALLFGLVFVVSAHLTFIRTFGELRDWLDGLVCARCGYDIRATPSRCPECGTSTPASVMR